MGSQKGDNPKSYMRVIAPFLSKIKLKNSTQRIGLTLLTNVNINMCDRYTNEG